MTPDEFRQDVVPVVMEYWPRYRFPQMKQAAVAENLSRFVVSEVGFEVHQYAKHNPDATKPNWESICNRLGEYSNQRPTETWSIGDETQLAWIQEEYRMRGKVPPNAEYIATQHMRHSRGPTESERHRARELILASFEGVRKLSPNFVPTIEGHRKHLDALLAEKARIDALAPVQVVGGKRREKPLCEQHDAERIRAEAVLKRAAEASRANRTPPGFEQAPF